MFFSHKYHIASLAAVFLALGLGMLIGIAMPFNNALTKQHQKLTASLEMQLIAQKQLNSRLTSQIKNMESEQKIQKEFEKLILPSLISGKLSGHRIAVIGTTGRPLEQVSQLLQSAGAEVCSITNFLNIKGLDSLKFSGKLSIDGNDKGPLVKKIAGDVAKAILSGNNATSDILIKYGIIHVSGNYGQPLDAVLVIGGTNDKEMVNFTLLDYPIIEYFKVNDLDVYGAEESNAKYSYIKAYQKKRLSTVDNIDTIPGQVALVYAISGNPGQYGTKPTAKVFMPLLDSGVPVNGR